MGVSTVMSAASFSVVLGEVFAAVGLSTTVPAGVVALARMAKALSSTPDADKAPLTDAKAKYTTSLEKTPAKPVIDLIDKMSASLDELPMLLPKTAKIHAEFTYEGRDLTEVGASLGAQVEVVSVNAGFSALYESKSTNKITLDVDFVSVNVPL